MAKMRFDINKWSAEKLSHTVLCLLVGIAAVVFLLFFFVGYDMPAMWDERYNSPLFTDLVLLLMGALLIAAIIVSVYAKVYSMRKNKRNGIENGINSKAIALRVAIGVVIVMALTYAVDPYWGTVMLDGDVFDDRLWLRMANMFVLSSLLFVAFGIVLIGYAAVRNRRVRRLG